MPVPTINIAFFGTYNTKTTPLVQGLIDGLRAHGVAVSECNAPLMIDTATRVKILHEPWRLPVLGFQIIRCWAKLALNARKLPDVDAVVVGHLGQFDIHLVRLLFRRKTLVLDYMISGSDTARDRRANSAWKNKLLRWLDNSALKTADIVVVDSEEHRLGLPNKFRSKGVVVKVGAPENWFTDKIKKRVTGQPLKVIFFGLFTPLQGVSVIGRAITRLTEPVEITMVGKGQDLEAAKEEAAKVKSDRVKVKWIDWVDGVQLPKFVAEHDICLGIFGTGPKSYKVVPNKVYGGAAAGCAIITSDTPPQRRVLHDVALLIPPGDSKALARAIDTLSRKPELLARYRQAAYGRAINEFTPKEIVRPLMDRLTTMNSKDS